jgi:hypothetical protein
VYVECLLTINQLSYMVIIDTHQLTAIIMPYLNNKTKKLLLYVMTERGTEAFISNNNGINIFLIKPKRSKPKVNFETSSRCAKLKFTHSCPVIPNN